MWPFKKKPKPIEPLYQIQYTLVGDNTVHTFDQVVWHYWHQGALLVDYTDDKKYRTILPAGQVTSITIIRINP